MGTRNRRHEPPINSLGVSPCATWIVAVDNWGKVLESRKVEAGSDLYDELVQEHLRYHRAGWSFEERMFYNREFHVQRKSDTPRRVYCTSLDPARLQLETAGHYDRHGWEFRVSTGHVGHRTASSSAAYDAMAAWEAKLLEEPLPTSTTASDWENSVRGLVKAVGIAREAYSATRRQRDSAIERHAERLRSCEIEIATYLRRAHQCIERATAQLEAISDSEWRSVLLDVFRAHSVAWESNWIRFEGLPYEERGYGLGPSGADVVRCIRGAVAILAATNPEFLEVDWNGRELSRPISPK